MAKVMSRKEEGRAGFPNIIGSPLILFVVDDYAKWLRHIALIFQWIRRKNPIKERRKVGFDSCCSITIDSAQMVCLGGKLTCTAVEKRDQGDCAPPKQSHRSPPFFARRRDN